MSKCVETYFELLREYFGKPFKIAVKLRFNKDKFIREIIKIFDSKLSHSILNSFYFEFDKIDWDSQEKFIRDITGFKATYFGSSYRHLGNSTFSDFFYGFVKPFNKFL